MYRDAHDTNGVFFVSLPFSISPRFLGLAYLRIVVFFFWVWTDTRLRTIHLYYAVYELELHYFNVQARKKIYLIGQLSSMLRDHNILTLSCCCCCRVRLLMCFVVVCNFAILFDDCIPTTAPSNDFPFVPER